MFIFNFAVTHGLIEVYFRSHGVSQCKCFRLVNTDLSIRLCNKLTSPLIKKLNTKIPFLDFVATRCIKCLHDQFS